MLQYMSELHRDTSRNPELHSSTPFRSSPLTRAAYGAALCALLALSACSSAPKKAPEEAAPKVQSLEEWMSQADKASKAGQRDKARELYRSAAKNYPTAKQPWQKLAEDYFNVADYGNAVLAGQETLQRDPQDSMAHSILAVSGLRITAGSLKALRRDASYPVGSRDEALAVTKSLREALGETTLVAPAATTPAAAAAGTEPAARPAARRPAPKPAGSAAAPAPAAKPTPAPAPKPAPAPAGNPLDKLR